ncbi:hypothetical protein D3C85_1366300 [compost metagenome]
MGIFQSPKLVIAILAVYGHANIEVIVPVGIVPRKASRTQFQSFLFGKHTLCLRYCNAHQNEHHCINIFFHFSIVVFITLLKFQMHVANQSGFYQIGIFYLYGLMPAAILLKNFDQE